jgi:hypothetical protein
MQGFFVLFLGLTKPPDTVGQPPSTEIGVLNMPTVKAKKLRKHPQEKVLLELCTFQQIMW